MLLDVSPPAEELFPCDPPFMRQAMTDEPLGADPRFAPVFAWRDRVYREHRGRVVVPARAQTSAARSDAAPTPFASGERQSS